MEELVYNRNDATSSATATLHPAQAASPAVSTTSIDAGRRVEAEPLDRGYPDASQDNDPALPPEGLADDEEEVFFGPVTTKEKKKASEYARRRTAIFKPGTSGGHLRKRVTLAPSDLMPTLSEMGPDDNPSLDGRNARDSFDHYNDKETERGCLTASNISVTDENNSREESLTSEIMDVDDRITDEVFMENCDSVADNHEYDIKVMIEPAPRDVEKALRRDSLLVIQEIENHSKHGKRCENHDCSLCVLDEDVDEIQGTNGQKEINFTEQINGNGDVPNAGGDAFAIKADYTVGHDQNVSMSASDGYNSDDDFLLMEQSCHESFSEDPTSPVKTSNLDTTVDCVTKSISNLRLKPETVERKSMHAFCRYTPAKQKQTELTPHKTLVIDTPEDDQDEVPAQCTGETPSSVTFTENSFSPNLIFKDARKSLRFNENGEEESFTFGAQSSNGSRSVITEFDNEKNDSLPSNVRTESELKFNGRLDTTVDIVDIACHDKSCFDLNLIEANTSSENSFEQDTTDSVCSSEEGSNKENQPQTNTRLRFQTPPLQTSRSMRYAVSEQRPVTLQLQTWDDGRAVSPCSGEGASPMTMEEILARKKAQMQQLRQEQQKFSDKLTTRHSPSPAREIGERKGLTRSPLTGSFRSPTARLPNTLPRVRYRDSHCLSLEGKQLDAVTKLHTMCNSQRSVKLINKPRKNHGSRIVTVVADEGQRIKWSDLTSASPEHGSVSDDSPDAQKSERRKSIIKVRPKNYLFPFGDESPASIIINKTAHHASSLQKAVIDKVSSRK